MNINNHEHYIDFRFIEGAHVIKTIVQNFSEKNYNNQTT
jgi:hypothetical protein